MNSLSAPTIPRAPLPVAPPHRRAVERVIEEVSAQLGRRYSLRDLASRAYLSPYHFHRVFRQATGVPPGRFLAALRIEAAKRLLATSDLTVTQVCFEVGYQSPGTFASQFSRLVGVSPRGFRRLVRGQDGDFTGAEWQDIEVAWVEGELASKYGFVGAAFVGLFPTALPEGVPSGCRLGGSGSYRVGASNGGMFHVLAVGITALDDLSACFLCDNALVGRAGPILVRRGRLVTGVNVVLRPRRVTDPPLLLAPAALFARGRGGTRSNSNGQEDAGATVRLTRP